jgi:hypothetical protein
LCTPPLATYIIVAIGFVRNEWGVRSATVALRASY